MCVPLCLASVLSAMASRPLLTARLCCGFHVPTPVLPCGSFAQVSWSLSTAWLPSAPLATAWLQARVQGRGLFLGGPREILSSWLLFQGPRPRSHPPRHSTGTRYRAQVSTGPVPAACMSFLVFHLLDTHGSVQTRFTVTSSEAFWDPPPPGLVSPLLWGPTAPVPPTSQARRASFYGVIAHCRGLPCPSQ